MQWQRNSDLLTELNNKIEQLLDIIFRLLLPPHQIIIDDVELRNMLKMSKRSSAYLREKGMITYTKIGSKIYYKLSDVLELMERNQVKAVKPSI
jgi:hypothetical protein